MKCERCGKRSRHVHEVSVRRVRDLPILGWDVVLKVPRRRLCCEHCQSAQLEHLEWLEPYRRVTNRLAEVVGRLC